MNKHHLEKLNRHLGEHHYPQQPNGYGAGFTAGGVGDDDCTGCDGAIYYEMEGLEALENCSYCGCSYDSTEFCRPPKGSPFEGFRYAPTISWARHPIHQKEFMPDDTSDVAYNLHYWYDYMEGRNGEYGW